MNNLQRGILSNVIGLLLLVCVASPMQLGVFAAVSLVINWTVYIVHALPNNSEKFFDATGSLTYLSLMVSSVSVAGEHGVRQTVAPILVCIWCVRLGSYLFARISKDHKDSRFDDLKVHWLRFLGVWTIQSVWCFFVASPALVVVTFDACNTTFGILDIVGWSLWLLGFLFEVIADRQKDSFRSDVANKGKFITVGLWAYSRHPNYFGEIIMWIGISLSGSSCFAGAQWLAWLSPLTTILLLTKVSGVPMLEKKGKEKWGELSDYQWYMKHTPCIIPALRRPPAFGGDAYIKIS